YSETVSQPVCRDWESMIRRFAEPGTSGVHMSIALKCFFALLLWCASFGFSCSNVHAGEIELGDSSVHLSRLAWSPDETLIGLMDRQGQVTVIRRQPGRILWQYKVNGLRGDDSSPDSSESTRVLTWSPNSKSLAICNLSTNNNLTLRVFQSLSGGI